MSNQSLALSQHLHQTSYADVEKILYQWAHRFARRYNAEFEDVLSEANLCFVLAHRKYNPKHKKHAKFSTYLCFFLTVHLITYLNKHAVRQQRFGGTVPEGEEPATQDHHFLTRLEGVLSDDAYAIALLVVEVPKELDLWYRWDHVRTPTQALCTLQQHLEQEHGWAPNRVAVAFDELHWLFSRDTSRV